MRVIQTQEGAVMVRLTRPIDLFLSFCTFACLHVVGLRLEEVDVALTMFRKLPSYTDGVVVQNDNVAVLLQVRDEVHVVFGHLGTDIRKSRESL